MVQTPVDSILGPDEGICDHLVVDTGPILQRTRIERLGRYLHSVPHVFTEVKTKPSRDHLASLPFPVEFVVPSQASLDAVTAFAKSTGDARGLSQPDINVMARTLDLVKLYDPDRNINSELVSSAQIPAKKWTKASEPISAGNNKMPGFYWPTDDDGGDDDKEGEENESKDGTGYADDGCIDENVSSDQPENKDDDDDSWITVENINEMRKLALLNGNEDAEEVTKENRLKVACVTTDYAMQNVLLQMNIPVVSVSGLRIKTARAYALHCFSCLKITLNTRVKFCPYCGRPTFKRALVTTDEAGRKKFKILNPHTNLRGTIYSLPAPKGGKHAANPIIISSQRLPHQRAKKTENPADVFSPDYIARPAPFSVRDISSKSAQLGIRKGGDFAGTPNWARRNPNEGKPTGKSHRKKRAH